MVRNKSEQVSGNKQAESNGQMVLWLDVHHQVLRTHLHKELKSILKSRIENEFKIIATSEAKAPEEEAWQKQILDELRLRAKIVDELIIKAPSKAEASEEGAWQKRILEGLRLRAEIADAVQQSEDKSVDMPKAPSEIMNDWLIVQEISVMGDKKASTSFVEMWERYFLESSQEAKQKSYYNPLAYRMTVSELQAYLATKGKPESTLQAYIPAEGDPAHPGSALAAVSVPIIYFSILEDSDDKQSYKEEREKAFLDSSIWHRHVSIKKKGYDPIEELAPDLAEELAPDLAEKLAELLSQVLKWHQEGRYSALVAHEYLDFAIQQFRSPRLARIGREKRRGTGHAHFVPTHGFQSEDKMKIKADGFQSSLAKKDISTRWPFRCLVLDDFVCKELTAQKWKPSHYISEPKTKTKSDIIKSNLGLKPPCEPGHETPCSECEFFCCVKSVDEALEQLKQKATMYDVIFLDYLLGPIGQTQDQSRDLGTSLVDELEPPETDGPKDKQMGDYLEGPFGHFWIFPISTFTSAFASEFSSGNIQNIGTRCYLVWGADPVCTPELFNYQFLQLAATMINQIKESPERLVREFLDGFQEPSSNKDSVSIARSVRQCAKKWYPQLVEKLAMLRGLRADRDDFDSKFAEFLLKRWEPWHMLLEHITRLLHLLVWEPQTAWPQMAEELRHIEWHLDQKRVKRDLEADYDRQEMRRVLSEARKNFLDSVGIAVHTFRTSIQE